MSGNISHCSSTLFTEAGSLYSQTLELADMSGLSSQLALEIFNLCLQAMLPYSGSIYMSSRDVVPYSEYLHAFLEI